MPRIVLLCLLIYILVFAGLASLRGDLLLLVLPLLLYLLAAVISRPHEPSLTVVRKLDAERVFAAMPIDIEIVVTNRGVAIHRLVVEAPTRVGLQLLDGPTRLVTSLDVDADVTVRQTLEPARGLHQVPPVVLTVSDRFGLFPQQLFARDDLRILALPQVLTSEQAGVRPPRTRVFAGPIGAHKGGPGVEFFGVRAYQPGDSRQWINQRATARRPDELFVNEFEQERAVDIGLILDVRRDANLPVNGTSLLESSVAAAATLADSFLAAGNRVGLFLYGGSIDRTIPGYGKIQRERILRALARARPEEHQVFNQLAYLPTRLFPIRSQLVLVSPLLLGDLDDLISLRARGYELLIAAPDSIAFERRRMNDSHATDLAIRMARLERERFFAQLRQAGVVLFEWSPDVPFAHAARTRGHEMVQWRRGPTR